MIKINFSRLLKSFKKADQKRDDDNKEKRLRTVDPSDPIRKNRETGVPITVPQPIQRTAADFPIIELANETDGVKDGSLNRNAMDAATPAKIGDSCATALTNDPNSTMGLQPILPNAIINWFMAQTFIGYQACAMIAQHWLIDKACSRAGEDACRNGWSIKTKAGDDLDAKYMEQFTQLDIEFKVAENLVELNRFKNIFGIRVCIFEVESDDPEYYAKPFNIDGITKDSYRGISQVDPYWMYPMLTAESTADPSRMHFYDPEYWIISGRRYHRSHLCIVRGPQPADILKPTYYFGGIPKVQLLYERVYAAERTANEAPLLAMNKRTMVIHMDMDAVATNQKAVEDRLLDYIRYKDNYAIKILGKEEMMEQFDTSLADFDATVMNQYQLVAAIADVPATELLGTSPKGFNATGEFEMKSYNKSLVSIQKHVFTPFLDRHYLLLSKSCGFDVELQVIWRSPDTPTEKELAELNGKKAEIDERYVNMGSISPDDVLKRLKDDENSGYNRLGEDDDASATPGMTPENKARFEQAKAQTERGEAQTVAAGAKAAQAGVDPSQAKTEANENAPEEEQGDRDPDQAPAPTRSKKSLFPVEKEVGVNAPLPGREPDTNVLLAKVLSRLIDRLDDVDDHFLPEGGEPGTIDNGRARTAKPSVKGRQGSTAGVHAVIPVQEHHKLPKMKLHGMTIAIENPRGSIRKGQTVNGDSWSAKMTHHYGFIKGVMGADGDELDCFIGPNMQSDKVWVINNKDLNSGEFDEHKVMLGFDDQASAWEGYFKSYTIPNAEPWDMFDSMWEMSVDDFKQWATGSKDGCVTPLNEACIGATQSFPMTQ